MDLSTPDVDRVCQWLAGEQHADVVLEPLPGDVSSRRYLRRVEPGRPPTIIAVYPQAIVESGDRFVRTTELLQEAGVPGPASKRRGATPRGRGWREPPP